MSENLPPLPPEQTMNNNASVPPPIPPQDMNANMPPLPPQAEQNQQETNEEKVKKCPNCGSALVYDPKSQSVKCPNCGSVFDNDALSKNDNVVENDLTELLNGVELNEEPERLTIKCPTCGAESELDENLVAGFCSYCKSPIVASSRSKHTIRPHGIIPFSITQENAAQAFGYWVKSLWFAPNALKNVSLTKKLNGSYKPIWTFDFGIACNYTGERGTYYYETKTRVVNGKKETYKERKTRWWSVSGTVRHNFDDIVSYASRKRQPASLQAGLAPWKLLSAVDYSEDIVRGFYEENYDFPIRNGLDEAKNEADKTIEDLIRKDIGGDEQRITSKHVRYYDLTYKQLLLPFWFASYHYNGKDFLYLVNGQTGKAHGERPYSVIKIVFFIIFIIAVIVMFFIFVNNGSSVK